MQKYTPSGTLHRTHQQVAKYQQYRRTRAAGVCEFCMFDEQPEQVVVTRERFWIVRNLFPYDIWDDRPVDEHLMIVPRRHIVSLAELDLDERRDYIDLIADYEQRGYNIYSRTDASPTKSVSHQHTHLIRVRDEPISALYYSNDPHVLVYK